MADITTRAQMRRAGTPAARRRLALLLWFAFVPRCGMGQEMPLQEVNGLDVSVKTDKASYLPGELISLVLQITNRSGRTLTLSTEPSVWSGQIKVLVAYASEDYKDYRGPGWGLRDALNSKPIELAPGDSLQSHASVLYHHAPRL